MITRWQWSRISVLSVLFALASASGVLAQLQFRPATDTETRAAYCMMSTKATIDVAQALLPTGDALTNVNKLSRDNPIVQSYNQLVDFNNALISRFNRYRTYVMLTLTRNVEP